MRAEEKLSVTIWLILLGAAVHLIVTSHFWKPCVRAVKFQRVGAMRGLHHFDAEECCDKKTYLAFGSLHVRPRMDYPRFLLTVNTLTVKAALLPYTHLAKTRKGNREAKARVVEKPATVTLYNPESKP